MSSRATKQSAYYFGLWAEWLALMMLRFKGYNIIAHRYKTKLGEIDIIAAKSGLVSFIEVKARKNKSITELVSNHQQQRICRAAALFIAKQKNFANLNKRFDVIVIYPWKFPRHITQAWDYFE